VNDLTSASEI